MQNMALIWKRIILISWHTTSVEMGVGISFLYELFYAEVQSLIVALRFMLLICSCHNLKIVGLFLLKEKKNQQHNLITFLRVKSYLANSTCQKLP